PRHGPAYARTQAQGTVHTVFPVPGRNGFRAPGEPVGMIAGGLGTREAQAEGSRDVRGESNGDRRDPVAGTGIRRADRGRDGWRRPTGRVGRPAYRCTTRRQGTVPPVLPEAGGARRR